jgi:hypothetical protein
MGQLQVVRGETCRPNSRPTIDSSFVCGILIKKANILTHNSSLVKKILHILASTALAQGTVPVVFRTPK